MTIESWMDGDEDFGNVGATTAAEATGDDLVAYLARGVIGDGEEFDKVGIATIFGLTVYAIDEAIKRGAPVVLRGNRKTPWKIAAGAFQRWYIKDKIVGPAEIDPAAAEFLRQKTRMMIATADRVEYANAGHRENSLTRVEARSLHDEQRGLVAKHMARVPRVVSKALAKLSPEERVNASYIEEILSDAFNDAMKAICNEAEGDSHDDELEVAA